MKHPKPKYQRVLSLLEQGSTLTIGGHTLVMGERNGVSAVAIKGTQTSGNGVTEPILLDFDVPLNHFIALCEQLSDEYLWQQTPLP